MGFTADSIPVLVRSWADLAVPAVPLWDPPPQATNERRGRYVPRQLGRAEGQKGQWEERQLGGKRLGRRVGRRAGEDSSESCRASIYLTNNRLYT